MNKTRIAVGAGAMTMVALCFARVALAGLAASFVMFVMFQALTAPTEATDPAALVGQLSDVFHEDLRIALLCLTPLYIVGALLIALCFRTYGDDLAMVVAEAEADVGRL